MLKDFSHPSSEGCAQELSSPHHRHSFPLVSTISRLATQWKELALQQLAAVAVEPHGHLALVNLEKSRLIGAGLGLHIPPDYHPNNGADL